MLTPLISYSNLDELKVALSAAGIQFDSRLGDRLHEKGLPPLTSSHVFGFILGVSPKIITFMAKKPDKFYRSFPIKKRSGGIRRILAPRTYLKVIQRYILGNILEKQSFPKCVTAFTKKRGIVQNASYHVGARFLLNVDLKDFFGSVKQHEVIQLLRNLGFSSNNMAELLAGLCTFGGSLPQGAPTSPALANLVFAQVDQRILGLCRSHKLKYSRYADDLTFSGRSQISSEFLVQLTNLLSRFGYEVNRKKVRFARPGQAKFVTGMIINEKVQPQRASRRRLRAMFHQSSRNAKSLRLEQVAQLQGWASFVNSYDQRKGKEYFKVLSAIRMEKARRPS
jgi:retron-type reverse transcriptase